MASFKTHIFAVILTILVMFLAISFYLGLMSSNNPNSIDAGTSDYQYINNTMNTANNTLAPLKNGVAGQVASFNNESNRPVQSASGLTNLFLITQAAFSFPIYLLANIPADMNFINDFIFARIFGANSAIGYVVMGTFVALLIIALGIAFIEWIRTGFGSSR